jgi:hypothetical protein
MVAGGSVGIAHVIFLSYLLAARSGGIVLPACLFTKAARPPMIALRLLKGERAFLLWPGGLRNQTVTASWTSLRLIAAGGP